MLVRQILNSKPNPGVLTVTSTDTVADAARILAEKKIGSVVVSDDGGKTAVGILSERDIVRELSKSGGACLKRTVGDYMTSKLFTCTSEISVQEVLSRMTEGRFRHMPVVEDGQLIGLVTLGDLVKAQLSEVEMEKEALKGMIMGH